MVLTTEMDCATEAALGAGAANGNGIITDGLVSGVADSSDPRWGGDGGGGGVNGRGAGFQDIDLGGLSQVDVSSGFPCSASLWWITRLAAWALSYPQSCV